jgi:hypothetical protein
MRLPSCNSWLFKRTGSEAMPRRRFTHLDEADFTLDEVISSSADHNDTFAADAQRRATISMS